MSESLSPEAISKVFKEVFADKNGQIVLEKIKTFCLGNMNQNLAETSSENQTFYNLGAYSVYRYIQYHIDMKLGQVTQDCVIEIEDETGD